jgi:hypothetical protein
MKIRDHPNLVHWPPTWIQSLDNESLSFDKSEDLVLKEVELLPQPPNDYHSYIRIFGGYGRQTRNIFRGMSRSKTFISIIIFMKDSEFLDHLYQKLKSSVGLTIREIGDSEI